MGRPFGPGGSGSFFFLWFGFKIVLARNSIKVMVRRNSKMQLIVSISCGEGGILQR